MRQWQKVFLLTTLRVGFLKGAGQAGLKYLYSIC